MVVKKSTILSILAFLFLVHGMFYFFVPDDVHNPDSPFKYIKYVVFLLFVSLSFKENMGLKFWYAAFLFPLFFYYNAINSLGDAVNFVAYVLPVYLIFSAEHIKMIRWERVILLTILFTSVFGYYEILFLDNHFYMYNASKDAYRVVSIFVNPNNLGISMALLTFAYLALYTDNPIKSLILFVNGFLIVFLSVSKTGLGVYGLLTLFTVCNYIIRNIGSVRIRLKYFWYSVLILPFIGYAAYYLFVNIELNKIREISFETLYVRLEGNSTFLSLVKNNPLFPWAKSGEALDNAYLNLWGSFGLPFLIIFVVLNLWVFLIVRSKTALVFLLTFLIIGTTTNFLYLWPLGYFYWALIAIILVRRKKEKQILL